MFVKKHFDGTEFECEKCRIIGLQGKDPLVEEC
jgi:hypothetical protein